MKPNRKRVTWVLAGVAIAAVLVGGAGVAVATTGTTGAPSTGSSAEPPNGHRIGMGDMNGMGDMEGMAFGEGVSVPVPSESELAALATDVNTLAAALADTETRRTRLLGDVAHEMRTPLTSLDGYVEGLIDGVFPPTSEIFGSLSEELRRLHRLADDLSSLSRAQEQRLDLHPVDADLAAGPGGSVPAGPAVPGRTGEPRRQR